MLLLGKNTPKTDIFSEKSKWLVLLAISFFKSFIYIGKLNTHPKVMNSWAHSPPCFYKGGGTI